MGEEKMTDSNHDRILKILLFWVALMMVVVWLPLMRAIMDGESYQWGVLIFGTMMHGKGLDGDTWFLVAELTYGITLLYLGLRGARSPFAWLLLGWIGFFAANAYYGMITDPDAMRFEGETLGVSINIGMISTALHSIALILMIMWLKVEFASKRIRTVPPWGKRNTLFLIMVAIAIPLEYVLLHFGPTHGMTDKIGVFLTIGQWVLICLAMMPWNAKEYAVPSPA